MRRVRFGTLSKAVAAALMVGWAGFADAEQQSSGRLREFRFDYGAKIIGLSRGQRVRVWLPVPPSNEDQTVERLEAKLPAAARISKDPKYGNRILYFETTAKSGELDFMTSYRVRRREVRGLERPDSQSSGLSPRERHLFLSPNSRVPVGGRPLELLAGVKLPGEPLELGRALYDRVDELVRYDKSRPGYGRGDVNWVCETRSGNCSDFHSLFISFCRSRGLPARFEIGFPLPEERGAGTVSGYHCWAFFHVPDRGWIPVDISEADKHPERKSYYFGNLTENRITFSMGRDITLVPEQSGPPLNFFVYPYAEVDNKPWPTDKIRRKVFYEEL